MAGLLENGFSAYMFDLAEALRVMDEVSSGDALQL